MAHLSRWVLLLGVLALMPAAVIAGANVAEVLLRPDEGLAPIARHDIVLILSAVTGTFLLSTAAGLASERRWALYAATIEAGVLVVAGMVQVIGGGTIFRALGLDPALSVATLPASLAAILLGLRLLAELRRRSSQASPMDRYDALALALLGMVVVAGMASHLLAVQLAG